MKALSLRQPWAWLVVYGGKNIENRRWNTSFRGEFLIHAAKGLTRREYDSALAFCAKRAPEIVRRVPLFAALERGGIIGRAVLVDVLPPDDPNSNQRWHMREQYGFVLEGARPLPFRPCRGALGFFEVEYA